MKNKLLSFTLILNLLIAPAVLACTCMKLDDDLQKYGQLYTGYFTKVTMHKGPAKKVPYYEITARFEVTNRYKGSTKKALDLHTYFESKNCGIPIVVGVEYLLALGKEPDNFISRCSHTKPLTSQDRELLQLFKASPITQN